MDRPSVSVVILTFNEVHSIGQVLVAIPGDLVDEVLVVDGGSRDGTVALALAAGARVLSEPRRGYGRACASGAAAVRGKIVVFLDGDGADDPAAIPELVAPLLAGQAELALGSRLAGKLARGAMSWHQRVGNELAAWLIRRLYGVTLTDLAPFRAVQRAALLGLGMEEMTYGWPTEMIVKAARRGLHIVERPVPYRARLGGRSKISGTLRGTVGATYHILRTILRYANYNAGQTQ